LDALVERMLAMSPFTYRLAADDAERDTAYRLRARAALSRRWRTPAELPDGRECDGYDARALHVIGWHEQTPMATGRIVLPPGLPTEEECGSVVEPAGEVVDVGRMCVAADYQGVEHAAFVGLMCALYAEIRRRGFPVACGMMSRPARSLVGQLGLRVETLGPERTYWREQRAPVRFSLLAAGG
jgi:hypothetical protein